MHCVGPGRVTAGIDSSYTVEDRVIWRPAGVDIHGRIGRYNDQCLEGLATQSVLDFERCLVVGIVIPCQTDGGPGSGCYPQTRGGGRRSRQSYRGGVRRRREQVRVGYGIHRYHIVGIGITSAKVAIGERYCSTRRSTLGGGTIDCSNLNVGSAIGRAPDLEEVLVVGVICPTELPAIRVGQQGGGQVAGRRRRRSRRGNGGYIGYW